MIFSAIVDPTNLIFSCKLQTGMQISLFLKLDLFKYISFIKIFLWCAVLLWMYIQGQAKWSDTPDLNPCDFFLWEYLKSKVYSNRPQSIEQRKDAIRQEITAIPHEMTRWVIDNFHERLWQCVDNNGSHLTDLIFKT